MRLFALSDLHVDYDANSRWVEALSLVDYSDDILVLAGDISASIERFERCIAQLVRRFKKLMFVPGNHDMWITRTDQSTDSLAKFRKVCRIAEGNGALLNPYHLGQLSIVPLLSWYDFSFGAPDADLKSSWMDFHVCRWPDRWDMDDVTSHFLGMNNYRRRDGDEIIISFSHFLPRIDVISNLVRGRHRSLFPVLGTTRLERQIRELRSAVHIYGHSHINRNVPLDGTVYINNAFGYPYETQLVGKSLRCVYEAALN